MRCKTCMYTRKAGGGVRPHSWQHGQCSDCHYFGLYKTKETNHGWAGNRRRGYNSSKGIKLAEHTHSIVTKENIDLYCKLSQILRDKPCKPNIVLGTQKNYPANRERKAVFP